MFDSEKRCRAFLRNITDRLEHGGIFIGTAIDAERLTYKMRTEGNERLNIGN
jgi:hypothetical protein